MNKKTLFKANVEKLNESLNWKWADPTPLVRMIENINKESYGIISGCTRPEMKKLFDDIKEYFMSLMNMGYGYMRAAGTTIEKFKSSDEHQMMIKRLMTWVELGGSWDD